MARNVRTIQAVTESIRNSFAERRASLEKQLAELDKQLEDRLHSAYLTRQAAALIDGAGLPTTIYAWDDLTDFSVDLGQRLTKKESERVARQLVTLRQLLGPMKPDGKHLENAKRRTVRIRLRFVQFPTVTVEYVQRLPKDAKCKIRRYRGGSYSTLVCEC